jgi:aminodeoxyfutalosine deaminase
MSLQSYLAAIPKAELHVHLEGSIQPGTLLTLARRNGVELPADDEDGLRRWFTYRNFGHFIETYIAISGCLRTAEDYELIAYELGAEMTRQNIRYAEVTFTPATHALRFGVPHDTYFSGLSRGRERARQDFGVEMRWVFDLVHILHEDDLNRRAGDYTASVAIEGKDTGVLALGLGGPEVGHSFDRIAPWFEKAIAAGLHSAPHAGETQGPESVWGALRFLSAERIGHGVRAIEDPALIDYLRSQRITLEICPTSNIRLGIYSNIAAHPLRQLHDAGVTITINSDDPPLFNTTLNDEVALLGNAFDFPISEIDEVILNGVRSSFLSPERKSDMEESFRLEMASMKDEHLGG